jgi:photosynthetic reaction center cytochrome c subunit
MLPRISPWTALILVGASLALAPTQERGTGQPPSTAQGPTCEQVFKNIESFKGVPAKDLIPAMEFMAASLKYRCMDCHDMKDFATETKAKGTARRMIAMQRDINAKHFNGRLSVNCMSCHNGHERPSTVPLPETASLRHDRTQNEPKPEDLFQKHLKAVGSEPPIITFKGSQVSPTEDGKQETLPVEMVLAPGGRFLVTNSKEKFGSDGRAVWNNGFLLTDEPAAIFGRFGRSWRGANAFDGLQRITSNGIETVGKLKVDVVRATRTSTGSSEELYFDQKTGLLVRYVNITRSSLGPVVTVYDYSDYRSIKGTKAPMKIAVSFANGETWTMTFQSATVGEKAEDSLFQAPKGGQ